MTMMHSGRLVGPDNDAVPTCGDIVRGLARQVRFAGQADGVYTVLQHTFAMARHVEPHVVPFVLLHDATEAPMTDMPRPWKDDALCAREDALMGRISIAYGLPWPWPPEIAAAVKAVDYMAACAEALVLGYENSDPREWCSPWVEPTQEMINSVHEIAPFWSQWMACPQDAHGLFEGALVSGMKAWEAHRG